MYHIYKGKKLVTVMDNYRCASNYVRKHRGCRFVFFPD
jgi:hypothetical protein